MAIVQFPYFVVSLKNTLLGCSLPIIIQSSVKTFLAMQHFNPGCLPKYVRPHTHTSTILLDWSNQGTWDGWDMTHKCLHSFSQKPEWQSPTGQISHRNEKNIKMVLKKKRCWLDSMNPWQGAVVGSCEHGNGALGSRKVVHILIS